MNLIEQKVADLMAKMTLTEKVGQLNQYSITWDINQFSGDFDVTGPMAMEQSNNKKRYEQVKAGKVGSMLNVVSPKSTRIIQQLAVENSRLGIPLLFGYDVIHGYKTMFPIPLADAASWDLEAIEIAARIAAIEAAAAGLHWTFAPMVDISRDARWGRVMEGAGEDPYLGSLIAAARVKGFQGKSLSDIDTIAACAKHFAAYGFAEAGREYNTVDISEHTLRNVVLPPFKACVEAGVATFMNAFNEIGGVPATGDAYLQRTILKGEWGFDGVIVSDWGSVGEMVAHGFAADNRAAAKLALLAGSDMDMEAAAYVDHLVNLVKTGEVPEALVDDAVRRVLTLKFQLGLFDDPYKYCDEERATQLILSDAHLAIARDVARKSIVLLKNNHNLLPLPKSGKTIAVIGPLAHEKDVPLGSWRAQAITNSAVSLLEGIQNAVAKDTTILYEEGAKLATGKRDFILELTLNETDTSGFEAATTIAQQADVVVLAIGEDCFQSGEGRSQTDIRLAGVQQALLEVVVAANPNTVVVLMNGRPMPISWAAEHVPAIVEAWHLGSEAGNAIADVLFGDYNPSGKLPISFPRTTGQVPIYYNHKNTGRSKSTHPIVFWSHYTDTPNTPLYPFGHGLSYSKFEYSNLVLSSPTMRMDGQLAVSVTLTNSSQIAGIEVVQLYIRDVVASVTRPVKELKGFQRIHLVGGESRKITFVLTKKDLAFYTRSGQWEAEPGTFHVFVGTSSVEVLEAKFVLK